MGTSLEQVENSGPSLVEVGCGPFGMTHFMESSSLRIGVEPLAVGLNTAGFCQPLGCHSNPNLAAAVGEHTPIASETVGAVICFNMLDHIMAPEVALSECWRILRPGGLLFFNVNVIRRWFKVTRPILARIDKPHPYHWTLDEVIKMLKSVGFGVLYRNCQSRNSYILSLSKLLSLRKRTKARDHVVKVRVGENKCVPAPGNAIRHLGSNLLHTRLDLKARKRKNADVERP